MKVLVVGGGGREHAIIAKLAQDKRIAKLYCAPGNAGTQLIAQSVPIKPTDISKLADFAQQEKIDLTVASMDDSLVLGIVDVFQERGLKIFGPNKKAAEIESSKAFSKSFMKKYDIPTADYAVFDTYEAAKTYVETASLPIVVKADGLAVGKGVYICNTVAEAQQALKNLMIDKQFGASGDKVVIEEFLTGKEVSVLAFCDGKTVLPMESAMDHKKAFEGDKGLNTGGMGVISPSPLYTEAVAQACMDKIFQPTIKGLNAEGKFFVGVLFFGLILTDKGPYVIEYNCRPGDPETQALMPRFNSNLLDIIMACLEGNLHKFQLMWNNKSTVCVVLASGGYPLEYATGYEIKGLSYADEKLCIIDRADDNLVYVYHAGTKLENNIPVTNGGRVLNVVAEGNSLGNAVQTAYNSIKGIGFENMHYRSDIGRNNW